MLPEFIKETVSSWDILRETKLPVFIYGMGDGAVKILKVFDEKKITAAGFFASDEFVRGHSFMGHTVHSLSKVEKYVEEFIIVLAFGAGYPELYDKINRIASRHMLIAPDVPVYGGGLFDIEYCEKNCDKLNAAYELLADERSRKTYADIINFKISGNIHYLNRCTTDSSEIYRDIIDLRNVDEYIDMGAYNGDTVQEFLHYSEGNYSRIYALEPDASNFKKLKKNTRDIGGIEIYNAAAWSENTTLRFSALSGRRATLTPLNGRNFIDVQAVAGDSLTENADFIKIDVEGAEHNALLGCRRSIENGASLAVSLYHRNEDMFDIPLLVHSINPKLKLYVRHLLYIPAWETNLYCTL